MIELGQPAPDFELPSRGATTNLPCQGRLRICQAARRGPAVLVHPGAPGAAGAESMAVAGASVRFSGTRVHPLIVVRGAGFGSRPPKGTSAAHTSCGDYAHNGRRFPPGVLQLVDETHHWAAGASEDESNADNCIGIRIRTWRPSRVTLELGSAYGTYDHWSADPGDLVTLNVLGRTVRLPVRYP